MIFIDAGARRFQLRACALIRTQGHVLIHRAVTDRSWSLPGGRVEHGEAAAETLRREVLEELGSDAEIGPLRFLIENFFRMDGCEAHELGLYFDAVLAAPPAFRLDDVVHRCRDGDADLEFRWVATDPASLARWSLRPTLLRDLLADVPDTVQHHVHRDASLKEPS